MGRKTFIKMAGVVILVVAGWLIWFRSPTPAPISMPSPNGYDDFIEAGKLLTGELPNKLTATREELEAYVGKNQAALKLARVGLGHESRVRTQFTPTYMGQHTPELVSLRKLGETFLAEGRLAEWNQRTNAAVESYLEAITLGDDIIHGGVIIDHLVGTAIELRALVTLQALIPVLDVPPCRGAIKALESLEAKRASTNDTLRVEKEWSWKANGLVNYIRFWVADPKLDAITEARESLVKQDSTRQRQAGILLIDLAARAFELEKGRRPQSAKELVPDYLKAVPKDPATGADLGLPP